MANLFDYLTWRGDLPLTLVPLGEADAALLAMLCYNDMGDLAATAEGLSLRDVAVYADACNKPANDLARRRLDALYAMAASRRFEGLRICRYVNRRDTAARVQFSAMTAVTGDGAVLICFRGTDSTLVGWREDFDMSYETVPAQEAAVRYLAQTAAVLPGPILLTGHSKGGNLAFYASAHADEATQARIAAAYSFDGPGLDPATSAGEGYRRVEDRLKLYIPQSSVVGLLMDAHDRRQVVRSDAVGLMQHDVFSWQMSGPLFERAKETTFSSQLLDKSLHDWLNQATREQRHSFVDGVFRLLEASGAATTAEMKTLLVRNAPNVIQAGIDMDPDARRMLAQLAGRFVGLTTTNAWDMTLGEKWNQFTRAVSAAAGEVQKGIADALQSRQPQPPPEPDVPKIEVPKES